MIRSNKDNGQRRMNTLPINVFHCAPSFVKSPDPQLQIRGFHYAPWKGSCEIYRNNSKKIIMCIILSRLFIHYIRFIWYDEVTKGTAENAGWYYYQSMLVIVSPPLFFLTPRIERSGGWGFLSAETWMCKLGNIVHELWRFVHSFSFWNPVWWKHKK